jgi:hypothetical protein
MNFKFSIKNTAFKAEKEGDTFIRFSGVSEPFIRSCDRTSTRIGGTDDDPKIAFNTGLDDTQVKFFKWYNESEQKEIVKQIKQLKPLIADFYGGDQALESTNKYFWAKNRDVSRLSLTNEDIDTFFDTKVPSHALLYLSIVSGAFMDIVAPNREWAENHQLPHYLALETEETLEEEDDITRSDAHSALSELRKDASNESLFILAWCIQYDTNSFGAYLKSMPTKDLINYHIKFIDGKLQLKKKKNCPKVFLEYTEKWKGQQTRPLLYVEAYLKAGEYFGYIHQKTKRFETTSGTVLGNTIEEAVTNLMKPKFASDLETLRDQVENKWKE